jgi:hypothetical protein
MVPGWPRRGHAGAPFLLRAALGEAPLMALVAGILIVFRWLQDR